MSYITYNTYSTYITLSRDYFLPRPSHTGKKMRSSEVFDSKGAPLASLSDFHRNLPISSTNLKLLT